MRILGVEEASLHKDTVVESQATDFLLGDNAGEAPHLLNWFDQFFFVRHLNTDIVILVDAPNLAACIPLHRRKVLDGGALALHSGFARCLLCASQLGEAIYKYDFEFK